MRRRGNGALRGKAASSPAAVDRSSSFAAFRTRSGSRVVVKDDERSSASYSSASSEERVRSDEEGEEEEVGSQLSSSCSLSNEDNTENHGIGVEEQGSRKMKTLVAPITLSLKKVCKVCKKTGHEAGFKGATYIDCPMKPCFLCKQPGHTTIICPHRVAMEHGVVPSSRKSTKNFLDYVFRRQTNTKLLTTVKPAFAVPDQIDCAIIRFHSRRVTCLEFHPTENNVVLSGDKKGQIGIWKYGKLFEKTVYGSVHSCIVNNMKCCTANDGKMYASSSDGNLSFTDLETGVSSSLLNLNPDGWNGPSTWRMLYGLDLNTEKNIVVAADNLGYLYMVDGRSNTKVDEPILIHKKGSKVAGLHCNPLQPEILLSCGNDHFARIWDVRFLKAASPPLSALAHSRVVNSAYFSPITGSKIITTSQDNRIRVWDSIFRNLESPSREIVHSHDFNRHLTPFRAEWDPKDKSESLVVIGRYISENFDGVALHPIDFIDINTGMLVAEVMDPNLTTISPVNKPHPREEALATGTSRSVFIWRPRDETKSGKEMRTQSESKVFFYGDSSKTSKACGYIDGQSDEDLELSSKKTSKKKKKMKTTPF